MALVVFLRGVNVGGHRTFRPSALADDLARFDVVNVGAAGTLIVREPGPRARLRAELARRLPFEAHIAICNGRDLIRLEETPPFDAGAPASDLVRFVSVLSKPPRRSPSMPLAIPAEDEWLVRVLGREGRLVFGMYRRHMKTIGCLARIDDAFGAPATTRSWSTILAIVRILKSTTRGSRTRSGSAG